MARGNVKTVEAVFDALARRDVPALIDLFTDDAVFEPASTDVAEREPYVGHDGLRRYCVDLDATWDRFRVTVSEIRENGDHVVALGRIYSAGQGFVGDDPAGFVWKFRDGKIVSGKVFTSHQAALEAGGLVHS